MGDHEEPISGQYPCELGTDCESDSDKSSDYGSDASEYDFEELESLRMQKGKEVNDKLSHYKELDKSMTFKDLEEAKKVMNFYAIANYKPLKLRKSDKIRVRYRCVVGCPFVCLISEDKKGPGFKVKTLKTEHNCEDAFENPRAKTKTIAEYFRSKVQNNPKYKIKDMKLDLKNQFSLNVHKSILKRAKRMALQQLQGSFLDDYNRLKAYANKIRESKHVVINLAKDAMAEVGVQTRVETIHWTRRDFPKGSLQGAIIGGCCTRLSESFLSLAWAVVDKENTLTWTWFLELLKHSLNLKDGTSITFMSDMQKGLLEAIRTVLPLSNHRFCVRHIEANW
uniref:Protein FAR1-RELATED SEQUENCE n=1 Tax=Nicotiana tabacum TaxID=4097 RepID=A0A1S4DCF4_TOBAC